MALTIVVAPAGDGWAVRSPFAEDEMVFPGGAKAEAAAHVLAERFAREGATAEVQVFLRDGALAGSFTHPPKPPEGLYTS